jgi:hypothetical protein
MFWRALRASLLLPCLLKGAIIDQIAIVVGNSIVKDSDISRDIRVTDFLNGDALNLSQAMRKAAASRLIDQIFIRKEIEIGDYSTASPQEANQQLDQLVKQRFRSDRALQDSLQKYGITAPDLRSHFLWEITVLRFIDARFRPAVLVTDEEVEGYYKTHLPELRKLHPNGYSLDALRKEITDTLAAERVNKLFFTWLDDQRKQTKIKYFEASLK